MYFTAGNATRYSLSSSIANTAYIALYSASVDCWRNVKPMASR